MNRFIESWWSGRSRRRSKTREFLFNEGDVIVKPLSAQKWVVMDRFDYYYVVSQVNPLDTNPVCNRSLLDLMTLEREEAETEFIRVGVWDFDKKTEETPLTYREVV